MRPTARSGAGNGPLFLPDWPTDVHGHGHGHERRVGPTEKRNEHAARSTVAPALQFFRSTRAVTPGAGPASSIRTFRGSFAASCRERRRRSRRRRFRVWHRRFRSPSPTPALTHRTRRTSTASGSTSIAWRRWTSRRLRLGLGSNRRSRGDAPRPVGSRERLDRPERRLRAQGGGRCATRRAISRSRAESATECAAILDLLEARGARQRRHICHARGQLIRIVQMLTRLIARAEVRR